MMRLNKVYHRLSILSLSPFTLSPHFLSLNLVQSSYVCKPVHLRARPSHNAVRTAVAMASSKLRDLVPVNAALAEDASAGGFNGSVSSSTNVTAAEDEGIPMQISIIDYFFYLLSVQITFRKQRKKFLNAL